MEWMDIGHHTELHVENHFYLTSNDSSPHCCYWLCSNIVFLNVMAVKWAVVLSTLTKAAVLGSLDLKLYTSVIGQVWKRCYEIHPCNFNKFQSPGLQVAAPKVLVWVSEHLSHKHLTPLLLKQTNAFLQCNPFRSHQNQGNKSSFNSYLWSLSHAMNTHIYFSAFLQWG